MADRPARPQATSGAGVRALVRGLNELISALQRACARPLVLIVDGLDRKSLLAELLCDAAVTGPEFMRHGLLQGIRDFRPVELCNVPVLDRVEPSRLGPGASFFRQVVDKRVTAVVRQRRPASEAVPKQPFPDAIVERGRWSARAAP